jgi:hypothetical protein
MNTGLPLDIDSYETIVLPSNDQFYLTISILQ